MVRRLEDPIQENIVTYLRLALPKYLVFSIPNEAKRSARLGMAMKRRGMMPGIPDLQILQPQTARSYFLEVKHPDGKLRKNQRGLAAWMMLNSVPRATVMSVADAETAIKHWGLLP